MSEAASATAGTRPDAATNSEIKNIVLLSDGTGNAASRVWRTNVWRVFESLDLRSRQQVAIYDDGVGTSSFKPLAVLGGAFGWGLKRNVLDLYTFLCRNYEPNARIYAFGFSRGAFTIRVLLGLVANQGLIRNTSPSRERLPESELRHLAVQAYRAYRAERYHSVLHVESFFRAARDLFLRVWHRMTGAPRYERDKSLRDIPIHFVGLWDTVAAYGLPIDEMTRGISQWLWPLELPNRHFNAQDIYRARHAIAIDDERTTFHPVLWSESGMRPPAGSDGRHLVKDEKLSQVWFSGVHSNVGGGYPDDSLARVPLCWIMGEAQREGLRFKKSPEADPDAILTASSAADKDGRLYDSRQGMGGYYRYGPRKIYDLCHAKLSRREDDEVTIDLPKIHETAFTRTINGAHPYAPIGFPQDYAVVLNSGEVVSGDKNPFETPDQAAARADAQEDIWDVVWQRRVVYFATVAASFYLALFPVIHQTVKAAEFETPLRPTSQAIRLVGAFLPGFASWWIDAFASNPGKFLAGVAALVILMALGVSLGSKINDRMRTIWQTILKQNATPSHEKPNSFIYKLRTHDIYKLLLWVNKRHILPLLSAIVVLYIGFALINQLSFTIADAAGAYCKAKGNTTRVAHQRMQVVEGFPTKDPCWSTGLALEEGGRYRITVIEDPNDQWFDKRFPAQPRGFEIGELRRFRDRAFMFAVTPWRRTLDRPWFRPIARIGARGSDEYPLDPETAPALNKPDADRVVAEFKARRDGELFLYVNDAVFGWPIPIRTLYANNQGKGTVCVERLGRPPTQGPGAESQGAPSPTQTSPASDTAQQCTAEAARRVPRATK
jgi:uncharacterized protein (DUF2235 family)